MKKKKKQDFLPHEIKHLIKAKKPLVSTLGPLYSFESFFRKWRSSKTKIHLVLIRISNVSLGDKSGRPTKLMVTNYLKTMAKGRSIKEFYFKKYI